MEDTSDFAAYPEDAEVQSASFLVNITNQIYYPNWEEDMGEDTNCFFTVSTVYPNADWEIEIYDASLFYVQTLSGHTTNGVIESQWDLRDFAGNLRDDANSDPGFYSLTSVSPSGASNVVISPNPVKIQNRKDYPALGRWVVAYQDFFKNFYDKDSHNRDSILNMLGTVSLSGAPAYGRFPPALGNPDLGQTLPLRFHDPDDLSDTTTITEVEKDKTYLLTLLGRTDVRNFYIHSHGSEWTFCGGISAARLGTNIFHRYRFVFLDGCHTIGGNLPVAFGIKEPRISDVGYYRTNGIRPGVYVGFTNLVYIVAYDGAVHGGRYYKWKIPRHCGDYRNNFQLYWMPTDYGGLGRQLKDAFESAKIGTRNSGMRTREGSLYDPGDGIDYLGYDALRFNDFNQRSAWPVPP